jgi:hemerythrin-like domain-containing protein
MLSLTSATGERKKGGVMMKATGVLRAEHNAALVVLHELEQAATAAAEGAPVPAEVFQDIQEFLATFVDRCHHGKEEAEIFPRLVATGAADLVQRLEAEHATGRALAAAYAGAVQAYRPGNAASGAPLAAAARAYATHLRVHVDRETRELLPAMERTLVIEDEVLAEVFERIETERIGPGTHERLHAMIEGLAERIAPYLLVQR